MAWTLGYEDVNDHDQVRNDMLLAMLCGKTDMSGEERKRKRDQGIPLAGSSTLNRLELGRPDEASGDRYKKIVGDEKEMDRLLVDVFLESHGRAAQRRSGWTWMPPMIRPTATKS